MRVSQIAPAVNYPHVQNFIVNVLDMQFGDVRAMLQLPRPDVGIIPACTFPIVSSLCNLISGISTTIFKPQALLNQVRSRYSTGRAFRELVHTFFPYTPPGALDFPQELYDLCRNPMAHSVGLLNAPLPVVYTRIFHAPNNGTGWRDQELEDLENPANPSYLPTPGIVVEPQRWTLHCDKFYFDVIEMLRRLNADATQMNAAENRFSQGVHSWWQR